MLDGLIEIFKKNSNKTAYIINEEKITYEKLLNKSLFISKLLIKQGSGPIIIYGHKGIDMVISIIACLLSKRTYIPIDASMPINRINKIIDITNSSMIISNEEIELENNIEILKLEELIKYENEKDNEIINDIAYIIFTSGSTGEPKGVPISYSNLNNFINWISNFEVLSSYKDINVLNQASFSFDLSVADLYYSLINGHTLIALDNDAQNDYNKMFNVIKNVNLIVSTPTFIKLCIINSDFNEQNYPNLKCIYFCGERLENNLVKKIFDKFPNINIINAYGPTEATSAVSAIVITKEQLKEDILPVGIMNNIATNIFIENDEIVLKGSSVFSGYLNNNSSSYYKENNINCYKTGDLGYIKNNKLYCLGRKDRQVKYKGYRIELDEIESNIYNINGVKDCAVMAKYDENNAVKFIKAFVVLENITEQIVKEELEKMLPKYMIPKIIEKIEEIPINKNGKIDRKKLGDL